MNTEQLIVYTQRKELSRKAKKEIIQLISQDPASTIEDCIALTGLLLKLHSDVIYEFVIKCLPNIGLDIQNAFYEELKKANINKSTHVFVVIAALSCINQADAQRLLVYYIEETMVCAKINKQLFIGFERACAYKGSEIYFSKSAWDLKITNAYKRFLGEFVAYSKNDECKRRVLDWYKANEIPLTKSETELFGAIFDNSIPSVQIEPETENGKSKEVDADKTKEEAVGNEYDIPTLLKILDERVLKLCDEKSKNEQYIISLKEELSKTKLAYSELKLNYETATATLQEKETKLAEADKLIFELKRSIAEMQKNLDDAYANEEVLRKKLENLESAFNHAGRNEVEDIKNKIKGRLSSEYEKFLEIKAKEPDMDYYEILLLMIEEIYKVLRKNGIEF